VLLWAITVVPAAIRVGYGGEGGSPKRISGCVTLYDFLLA
jgi:hypothetical protein